MELQKFIENLAIAFEHADPKTLTPESKFRDLEGYSSFVALSIIAMVDEEYNFKLRGDDMRKSVTIRDLFNIISAHS